MSVRVRDDLTLECDTPEEALALTSLSSALEQTDGCSLAEMIRRGRSAPEMEVEVARLHQEAELRRPARASERQLRDAIVDAVLDSHYAADDDWTTWEAAQARLWEAAASLVAGRVSEKIWRSPKSSRIGRPPVHDAAAILADVKAGELSVQQIARKHGCHRNHVYYLIDRDRESRNLPDAAR